VKTEAGRIDVLFVNAAAVDAAFGSITKSSMTTRSAAM